MIRRCYDDSEEKFKDYGGRGIVVCGEWRESFDAFYAAMGERPTAKHSIDRIDNDGNYQPGNCRWATLKEQARNRRNSFTVVVDGRRVTCPEIEEKTGIRAKRIYDRLRRGKPLSVALEIDVEDRPRKIRHEQVAEMRAEFLRGGISKAALSRKYGISDSRVGQLLAGFHQREKHHA